MVTQCRLGVMTLDDPMDRLMYDTLINHTLARIANRMGELDEETELEEELEEEPEEELEEEPEEDPDEDIDSLTDLPHWWI